jgi:ATP-binding cassette, subfamily B, multidrug efflux pump
MRIIQYLKKSKLAVVLIMLLLCVQAYADLSLPRYTSDLVDVGIQQGGIEDAVPSQLTAETYTYLASELSGSQAQLLESSYAQDEGGNYELTDYGQQNRTQLDSAIELPLASKYFPGAVQESLVNQQAIAAVKLEYRALGMDEGSVQISYLLNIGLRMLGVTALMVVASVLVGLIASRTAAGIAANLRERLFARVVSFSDAEVQSFSAASLITRGTNDITQIQTTIVMLLRMVLYSPILAIGGIVMVAQTNVEMSWVIVLAVVVLAIVIAILMALALPKFRIMQKLIDRVNLVAREMLSGLQVVRAFGRQQHEGQRFNDASYDLYKTQLFTNRTMSFMMPAMMLVMNATSVLIVWAGGHAIDAGAMQTGDMIAFITYSMVIVMSFLMIGMIAIMLPRADVSAQRVNEVLACESSIKDPAQSHAAELAANAQGLPVQFKNVTFAYNQGSEPVLRDISFTAQPGQTTAIIGATGSGKTTILKLIERFYDATQGQVLVGGVDVRELNQHELRQNIGYVPQKAFLFSGSIAETISYGAEGAPEEELRRAAGIAQATEFIDSKEEGMQSPLSQGGTNVSGGQRQRLSIARALATDAPVLLFDDSFSALDYKTDAKLRTALAEEAGGKTVIVVAQRISTVLNADQILVLDGGGLVGCGTHSQLLETCRTYREIAESQLSEQELKGGVAQ